MRYIHILFLLIAVAATGAVPVPAIAAETGPPALGWQHLFGGSADEKGNTVLATADGGYLLFGETLSSTSGDVTGTNHGDRDVWLAKLGSAGVMQWQRLLGGSAMEEARSIEQTADGGYVFLACSESSTSGTVTGENHGGFDLWVVRLDGSGTILWQRLVGGSAAECGSTIRQTADGGYVLTGRSTSSTSGDVTGENHGASDIWIAKLDATGAIEWDRLLGGSQPEERRAPVMQTADGGYLIAGATVSGASGDVTGKNHGGYDLWVVKLAASGATEWERLLGGGADEIGVDLDAVASGGYVVLADSGSSSSGDVVGANHGGTDLWVVRLSPTGEVQFARLLGGSQDENGASIRAVPGGYAVLGTSGSSESGDVSATGHGGNDLWTAGLSGSGNLAWQQLWGGSRSERAWSLRTTVDGGYILLGDSASSASGDVTDSGHGETDMWVAKLGQGTTVPGGAAPPTDTDADGLFDDVNGNGRMDFEDVVLYFNQMAWIAANELVSAFDFNQNGSIDFADAVWLFNHL